MMRPLDDMLFSQYKDRGHCSLHPSVSFPKTMSFLSSRSRKSTTYYYHAIAVAVVALVVGSTNLFCGPFFQGGRHRVGCGVIVQAARSGVAESPDNDNNSSIQNWFEKALFVLKLQYDFVIGKNSAPYDSGKKKHDGLSVIGGGFSRTGTKSIEYALVTYYGHRIYDMRSIIENDHFDRWIQVAYDYMYRNDTTSLEVLVTEIEEMGYTATLDLPMSVFTIPLSIVRPKAKVLLSVRDTPDQWYTSFKNIYDAFAGQMIYCRPFTWLLPDVATPSTKIRDIMYNESTPNTTYPEYLNRPLPWYETIPTDRDIPAMNREVWIGHYERHIKDVIESVPEDRLLIFNVKHGWKPWIEFFGMPPTTSEKSIDVENDEPFPHVNDIQTIQSVAIIMKIIGIGFPIWVILFTIVLPMYLLRLARWLIVSLSTKMKMKQQ